MLKEFRAIYDPDRQYLRRYFDITVSGWSTRNSYSPFFWVPYFVGDLVNFFLVLYKYCERKRERSEEAAQREAPQTVYDIVIRDNMIYFIAYRGFLALELKHLIR